MGIEGEDFWLEHHERFTMTRYFIVCKRCNIKKKDREFNSKKRTMCNSCSKENYKFRKLKMCIRNLINTSINKNGYKKYSKTEKILGCSFEEFKIYIESKFEPWMSWDNRSNFKGSMNEGWDLDHIIPISSAKTEEEILKLNHYTNFQPLCSYKNRYIKRNKLDFNLENL